ncbi:MAG: hypothetical protein U5Q16_08220 [Gammaproteobacteria bacterium]|nr:hypothetical protein [Gammaproteobacteria bacterium]
MSDLEIPELPAEVVLAVQRGRKLDAIRILREKTGMGLSDAKILVDRLAEEYGSEAPQVSASREDAGNLRLLAALVILGGIAAAIFLL